MDWDDGSERAVSPGVEAGASPLPRDQRGPEREPWTNTARKRARQPLHTATRGKAEPWNTCQVLGGKLNKGNGN